jgi:hypothetical protein
VNSPEDGPVGPKHVEIRRYMNKIEIVTSVGFFISYVTNPSIGCENKMQLTFKNRASYIQDGHTTTLQMLHSIYIFSTNISTEYFKHAAHSPLFSSKMPFTS